MNVDKKFRKNVEDNLRSVTQSLKGGVPLQRLQEDYKELIYTPIPYKELGFTSLRSMIESMPGVIKIVKNNGQEFVVGVADEKTSHIVEMVSKQRSLKSSARNKTKGRTCNAKRGIPQYQRKSFPQYPRKDLQGQMKFPGKSPVQAGFRTNEKNKTVKCPSGEHFSPNQKNPAKKLQIQNQTAEDTSYRRVMFTHNCLTVNIKSSEKRLPVTVINSSDDLQKFSNRITQMVSDRPNGLRSTDLVNEYGSHFNESLPQDWLDITKTYLSRTIQVEKPKSCTNDEIILQIVKSSGKASPMSNLDLPTCAATANEKSADGFYSENSQYGNNQWAVHVVSVTSTVDIGVKLICDNFTDFCRQIDNFYQSNYLPAQTPIKIGSKLYITHLEVGGSKVHFRVQVEEILPDRNEVTCHFVDVGHSGVVKVNDLQELDPLFGPRALPYQAFTVKLYKLMEYVEAVGHEKLMTYLYDKAFIAELVNRDEAGTAVVKLYDTSKDNDVYINRMLYDITIEEHLSNSLPEIGSTTIAYLMHITDTGEFYVRVKSPLDHYIENELELLMSDFEKRPKTTISTDRLSTNQVYATKYDDGCWYRAVIVGTCDMIPDQVGVFHIDYGSYSWIPTTQLCELECDTLLAKLPPQTFRCSLSDLPPPSMVWTDEAVRKVYELLPENKEIIVKVDDVNGNTPRISIFKRETDFKIVSINFTLLFDRSIFGHVSTVAAGGKETIDCLQDNPVYPDINSEYFDVCVSYTTNPYNFVVQPFSHMEDLDMLQEELQCFYSTKRNICKLEPGVLRKGRLFAILHKDGVWYRARMVNQNKGSPKVLVQFVDYGDFDLVDFTNIQPLYKKFLHLPCQAMQARLVGIEPDNIWGIDDCRRFTNLVVGKCFVSKIVKKSLSAFGAISLDVELIDTSVPNKDIYIHKLFANN